MSRENLVNFIKATEYSLPLRKELSKLNTPDQLINLARKYGFIFNHRDIEEEDQCSNIEKWFKESEISPIKKF